MNAGESGSRRRHVTSLTPAQVPSGIPGLDTLLGGGLPQGRALAVAGGAGSGKTLTGLQFIVEGVRSHDEAGVVISFDETPAALLRNVSALEPDVGSWVARRKLAIVDLSPTPADPLSGGGLEIPRLAARIAEAVRTVGAKRLLANGVESAFPHFMDGGLVRKELNRLIRALDELGVTTILTLDRREEGDAPWRYGVEDLLADGLIVLRRPDRDGQRTLEVVKLRGFFHPNGEHPLVFTADGRISVIVPPLMAAKPTATAPGRDRAPSGDEGLDLALGGGLLRPGLTLARGATGTGKTSLALQAVACGLREGVVTCWVGTGEPYVAVRATLARAGVADAQLDRLIALDLGASPGDASDHLHHVLHLVEHHRPERLVIDSCAALVDGRPGPARARLRRLMLAHLRAQPASTLLTRPTAGPASEAPDDELVARCDTLLELGRSGPRRTLEILKHRAGAHALEPLLIDIAPARLRVREPAAT